MRTLLSSCGSSCGFSFGSPSSLGSPCSGKPFSGRRLSGKAFFGSVFLGAALLASPCLAKDFYVSALRGNDQNPGTIAQPVQTLTRASALMTLGDRLFVLEGRYTPTLGEQFPIRFPDNVQILGQDPRTCVIDAEFDVTLPDLKKNVVQGLLLQIGDNTTLSSIGIVNGPRNPKKQDDYWWAIALRVEGGSGGALKTVIDRVWLDRISRGIFWGYAAGDHVIQDNVIRNCVVSRFYVEAINGTANASQASNNIIYNCTLVGHVDPATKKPLGRANISFGPGMVATVNNCVIVGADWCGIEADPTKTTITSDYNCFFSLGGYFQPTRGPGTGTNDIVKDPLLGALPTMTTPLDPHHVGTGSPLFRAGKNQPNQASETDWDGKMRIFAGTVDIGADEYTGPDVAFHGVPAQGSTIHFGAIGTPNSATVFLLGFGQMTQGVPIPGLSGQLLIDPVLPILPLGMAHDANGAAVPLPLGLPAGLPYAGIELFAQGIDIGSLTIGDVDRVRTVN